MKYAIANPNKIFVQINSLYIDFCRASREKVKHKARADFSERSGSGEYNKYCDIIRALDKGITALTQILGITRKEFFDIGRIANRFSKKTEFTKCVKNGNLLIENYVDTVEKETPEWYFGVSSGLTKRQLEVEIKIGDMKMRREMPLRSEAKRISSNFKKGIAI